MCEYPPVPFGSDVYIIYVVLDYFSFTCSPPLLRIEVASNIHAQLADLLSIFEKLYFTILVLKTVTLFWYHFS